MWVRILHLQLVQLFSDLLVLTAKTVEFLLILAHSVQKLGVSSLTSEELLDDLLYIREACLCTNHLESLLNLCSPRHLLVHLALEEGAPELLSQEVFVHF